MLEITKESKLTKSQYKSFGPRPVSGYGDSAAIWAHVRYDDECGNGHNSFAITGSIRVPRRREAAATGCLHDEISAAFPELAHLVKWHLCSSDGPMYYTENTLYLAGDRDHYGKREGEPIHWANAVVFDNNPIQHPIRASFAKFLQENSKGMGGDFDFEVIAYYHERDQETFGPKYTFGGYAEKWHECPFNSEAEALNFLKALQTCNPKFIQIPTDWSKGKERDLDGARRAAIWLGATDEELTAPDLKERLEARLPGLLKDFRQAMEELGFTW